MNALKRGGQLHVLDLVRGPMQDVKEERLQHVRVLLHAIEVEGLEATEGQRVLRVVEYVAELPARLQRCSRSPSGPIIEAKLVRVRLSGSSLYMRSTPAYRAFSSWPISSYLPLP